MVGPEEKPSGPWGWVVGKGVTRRTGQEWLAGKLPSLGGWAGAMDKAREESGR